MPLNTLNSTDAALAWLRQREVTSLSVDSRRLKPGAAFVAWPGRAQDGRQYVRQALANGARACIVEAQGAERFDLEGDSAIAALSGLKAAAGAIASAFMSSPSEHLHVVATTGTNGKTSTAWWTAQALAALRRRCAVVGTLGAGELTISGRIAEPLEPTGMTTPDPVTLQALLRRFVDEGIEFCAIEASSIGIVEHRLAGTRVEVALFTNFSQDHLDYHETMTSYWQAKMRLFDWPGLKSAVVNIDDPRGADLVERLRDGNLALWTYSKTQDARLRADHVRYDDEGLCFEVRETGSLAEVRTRVVGTFNVANLLAVIGGLRALDVPLADAARACAALTPVPGRMQRVESPGAGPVVVIDYAHTPDALEQVLRSLAPLADRRGGSLWCVFGCGGNRDAGKRPLMGGLAARLAQHAVLTSDNPRDEPPDAIIGQILAGTAGAENVRVIEDRRAALNWAIVQADERDVVLVAGKGHEAYQEIAGLKQPFSDLEHARAALQQRSAAS